MILYSFCELKETKEVDKDKEIIMKMNRLKQRKIIIENNLNFYILLRRKKLLYKIKERESSTTLPFRYCIL